jgi:hypothetical protein
MKPTKVAPLIAIVLTMALSGTVLAATGRGLRASSTAGSVTSGPVRITCGAATLDMTVRLSYGSVSSRSIYVKTIGVTFKMNSSGKAFAQTLAVYQNNSSGNIYYNSPTGVDPNIYAGQTKTFVHSIYRSVSWSTAQSDYLWADQQFLMWSNSGSCSSGLPYPLAGVRQFYWYYVPGTPL